MRLFRPAIISRKKIILLGFFGRGNAGDEAFLHAQHQVLSKEFDLIIGVDRNAARSECYSWAPYNHTDCWSYDEFGRVFHDKSIHGINIGGGSLPFGFAGQFTMTALDAGKPVVMSGIDLGLNAKKPGFEFRKQILQQYGLIAVRHPHHFKTLVGHLDNAILGADWALGMKVEPRGKPIDVAVTIRESGEATEEHFTAYRRVISHFEKQGRRVTFVPFAPEDDALLDRMAIPADMREVHWHDPRTVLGRLAKAGLVVSFGRLHTLIFAIMAGRPAVSIDPQVYREGVLKKNHKNRLAAEVFGLKHFDDVDSFLASGHAPKARGVPADYQARFNLMKDRVLTALTSPIPATP